MKELVPLEEHSSFHGAASRAKEIAYEHKVQTGLRCSSNGWEVMVPSLVTKSISAVEDDSFIRYESSRYEDDDENYSYFDEEMDGLIEDFESDQDDWARSEDEGWYYEE